MRSRQPSRLEGFSDAVFGFALTLLVVSLEVPKTFDELMGVAQGFVPFAITFAYVAWIWYEHYVFFRRFDPDDRVTIVLNCTLLFVVLFYVYPLKFLFTLVVNMILGLPSFGEAFTRRGDGTKLMVLYGLGYIVVFVTLALMYFNVLRRQVSMRLTALETFEAKAGVQYHLGNAAVGLVSIAIVLVGGDRWSGWSGMSYGLLGVVHGVLGSLHGSRRAKLKAEENLVV
jgi:uncharacterized membrane protein